jgi:phosphatidylglycerol:prolipoprotein diacylglycerol transferase
VFPILFRIGSRPVYSYGSMIGVGIAVTLWLIVMQARNERLDHHRLRQVLIPVVLVGFLAARPLRFAVANPRESLLDPARVFLMDRGGTFHVGLLAAFLLGIILLRKTGLPPFKTLDIVFANLPLGHAFGRLGCFLGGCCYGRCSTLPFAVTFPRWDFAGLSGQGSPVFLKHLEEELITGRAMRSLPVHPTQLYSAVVCVVIFMVLRYAQRHKSFDGQVLCLYAMLSSCARFLIEFVRGDTARWLLGMTACQWLTTLIFIGGLFTFRWLHHRKRLGEGAEGRAGREILSCR